jgi:Mg2+/Co2+ transporter CorB
MEAEVVRIDGLLLRLPGLSEEEARRVAGEVMQRIAERIPDAGKEFNFGRLDLRISVPQGIGRDRLAKEIAQEILRKLQ